jgi:hypothetical protein
MTNTQFTATPCTSNDEAVRKIPYDVLPPNIQETTEEEEADEVR